MDLREFAQFTLAGAASGLPDVQHSDAVGCEDLLAADGVAVKVGGLEADAGSGEIGVRILGFIIVCTVDDVIRVLQQLVVQVDFILREAGRQIVRTDSYVMGIGSDRCHLIDLTARNHAGKLRIIQDSLVTVFLYTQESQVRSEAFRIKDLLIPLKDHLGHTVDRKVSDRFVRGDRV